jgi:succinylglutamate desuccinylase
MSNLAKAKTFSKISPKRIIGSIDGDSNGPTVVVLAGMHGNEPAGVEAAASIFDMLEGVDPPINGRLKAIQANIPALEENVRYIDEDMNRLWFPSIIDRIRRTPEHKIDSSERLEIKRLLPILSDIKNKSDQPIFLVDLHTFSADGYMFTITSTDPRQRELLSNLHVPMVFGIGKSLRGTALRYYQKQGFISFGLEGGQHQDELTPYNITSALILLLKTLDCIEQQYVSEIKQYERDLKSQTSHLPVETELVYQHMIEPGDDFRMRPGYQNFQPVKKGEWLANDRDGKIVARCDGYILMPLYQSQGDDGFFIIQEHES